MKIKKLISVVIIFIFMLAFLGCNEVKDMSDLLKDSASGKIIKKNLEKPFENKNEEEPKEINDMLLEYNVIYYTSGTEESIVFEKIWVEDYNDYLSLVKDQNNLSYDEEYFENNGLILYGRAEGSGSIDLALSSVILDDNNVINITLNRDVPFIGTCDMKYHQFIIEYQTPEDDVLDVAIYINNKIYSGKEFDVKTEQLEINRFIEEINDDIIGYYVWIFNNNYKDGVDRYEENMKIVQKYNLDRLGGNMYVSKYSSTIGIDINKDDIDLLYETQAIDDLIDIRLSVYYISNKTIKLK